MKKVFLTLALVAVSMAANAQWILGGQLGFNTNGGTYTQENASPIWDMPNNKAMGLTVAPTVSYVLNDKMQIGLTLEYNYGTATNYNAAAYALNQEVWSKTTNTMFTVAPYFRYYFANAGKFNFFCEAALGFGISPRTKNHDYSNVPVVGYDNEYDGATKTTMIGLTITPGVNYRISNHWSADCYIDLAGIAFLHNSVKTYGTLTDPDALVSTDVTNNFGLMCNTTAQDLNAHFGNFRIGFNYHF